MPEQSVNSREEMSSGITPLTVRGFFRFPTSKARLLEETKSSALLRSLWSDSEDGRALNAPTTLPLELKSKAEIYQEVKLENEGKSAFSISAKQGIAYGKALMKFYKTGVSNVWNNKKVMDNLMKNYKITNQIDNKGKDVQIEIPNFTKLTQELALRLSMNTIESRNNEKNEENMVVHTDASSESPLISLTRAEYQLINRTSKDFVKIPFFVLICLIFAETTPLLCYAFPQITPSTCVLPSILPRLWNSKASVELANLRNQLDQEQIEKTALQTAYNLPLDQVRLMCKTLRLTSKYVPVQLYPQSYLRNRLNNYYNYLKVDNYYLSGLNGGNIWDLSNQELVNACLERNLIKDISEDNEMNNIKDLTLKKQTEDTYHNELRIKLLKFIIDFENYNIGYLGLTHVINQPDTETIVKWRN